MTLQLPREHGFWVMLGAALIASLLRTGFATASVLVAVLVVVAVVTCAAMLRRVVRRQGPAQIASAGGLALVGVPVELSAHIPLESTLLVVAAWATLFVSNALSVRAVIARASQKQHRNAERFQALSLLIPALGLLAFAWLGEWQPLAAVLIAEATAAGFALLQPSVKRMKAIGLTLASIAGLSSILLGL